MNTMNTPSPDQNDSANNVELRMRTMRTLWIAMFMSIVMYYVFTLFAGRPPDRAPNNKLFLVLVSAAVVTTLISFPIKSWLVNKAIDQQQVQLVQQAYIVAWAVTEIGALLALLDFFLTGDPYYYAMLIISACGQILHFPKREHLLNASFKTPGSSDIWRERT